MSKCIECECLGTMMNDILYWFDCQTSVNIDITIGAGPDIRTLELKWLVTVNIDSGHYQKIASSKSKTNTKCIYIIIGLTLQFRDYYEFWLCLSFIFGRIRKPRSYLHKLLPYNFRMRQTHCRSLQNSVCLGYYQTVDNEMDSWWAKFNYRNKYPKVTHRYYYTFDFLIEKEIFNELMQENW